MRLCVYVFMCYGKHTSHKPDSFMRLCVYVTYGKHPFKILSIK